MTARYNVMLADKVTTFGDDLTATVTEAVMRLQAVVGDWAGPAAIDIIDRSIGSRQCTTIFIGRDHWRLAGSDLSGPTPRPLIIEPPDEPVDDAPIVEAEVHADVVQLLRDMLERAERGDVVAVAVAGVTATGGVASAYRSGDRFFALLGSVTLLQARMISEGDP